VGLSREDAAAALDVLWGVRAADLRAEREKEWKEKAITLGDKTMRFEFKVFGERPKNGRSLWISMHGGGGTTADVNDQQWRNQVGLYKPAEGVYLAPRAPTNTWNLWHEGHIDDFFDRIIADAVVLEGVDPDRVYLMGYSAGGDGVYQLAPRMADRFAAASMMAGHPNDARPEGLRNLPFAIHMGANDAAYDRNKVAADWGKRLDALAAADPEASIAYPHVCELHAGKGHWMDREDAKAVPWMAGFTRGAFPKRVVWVQSGRTHDRFYWLAVPAGKAAAGAQVVAAVDGQEVTVEASAPVETLELRLSDRLVDLDKPVRVRMGGVVVSEGVAPRRIAALWASLEERADPASAAPARIVVSAGRGAGTPK
jgi:predicted esterase